MNESFNDVLTIWELRGSYPDIKHFEDVDIAELTKGDSDPMFLTIPIGQDNVTSGNKRFYDSAWVSEIERQVKERKPIGIMGHLREEDLGTQFPPEAVHWIGVQKVGEMLWAKGYLAPGPARERVRRYKATNKKLATSIFAEAEGVWDTVKNATRMLSNSLNLKQIDIGPADRVGIPSLAAVPMLTAEMQDNPASEDSDTDNGEPIMDKLQVIQEMTADDARLLPKPVQDAILATVQPAPEVEIVTELCAALGVEDGQALTAVVTEMKEAQAAAKQQAVTVRVSELVSGGIKIESMRGIVTELITAKRPATVEEAEAAYTAVIEMESVKQQLAAAAQAAMGPNHQTPAQPANGQKKYFAIPEEK